MNDLHFKILDVKPFRRSWFNKMIQKWIHFFHNLRKKKKKKDRVHYDKKTAFISFFFVFKWFVLFKPFLWKQVQKCFKKLQTPKKKTKLFHFFKKRDQSRCFFLQIWRTWLTRDDLHLFCTWKKKRAS